MGEAKKRGTWEERRNQALAAKRFPLYRFFKSKERAKTFLEGKIWVSTLQECRNYEDAQQGDKGEGTSFFTTSIHTNGGRLTTPQLEAAMHGGVYIHPDNIGITINSIEYHREIDNGYLLCTTSDPKLLMQQSLEWQYGVELLLPADELHCILTNAFQRQGINIAHCKHGWADYKTKRSYSNYKEAPEHLAFVSQNIDFIGK